MVAVISFWVDILLFLITAVGLVYAFLRHKKSYWARRGLSGPKPHLLMGNMTDVFKTTKGIGQVIGDLYLQSNDLKCAGVYMPWKPTVLVNDLDMIKNVLIKDFDYFMDRSDDADNLNDPLAKNLFGVRGETWRRLREKVSPAFMPTRIKQMFPNIQSRAEIMSEYLNQVVEEDGSVLDLKEIFAKYTTDVIGSCAFGLECNSFKDPDAEFRRMGKRLFTKSMKSKLKGLLFAVCPWIVSKLKISIFDQEINDFFYNTVESTIEYRSKNKTKRNDFIQLLIDMKNEDDKSNKEDDETRMTTMQIAANMFIFFIGGFETSSTVASFTLQELALNHEIQKKLTDEIDLTLEKNGGKMTYESISEMTYLGKVFDELLRKYPPFPATLRICTKDYKIPGSNVVIEEGTQVAIPTYGIHRDPRYYPDPEKFDPERFTKENKETRPPFSYLPFGEGPRICIAIKLAMTQTKVGLVEFLSKYEVSVCEKTSNPIMYDKGLFLLSGKDGVWLKVTKRIGK